MTKSMLKNIWKWVNDVIFSFPTQLLVFHFKRNHLLLLIWLILAGYMTGVIGKSFGLIFLFLNPEYLGQVNFWSFGILGFAFGQLLMTWNLTTYLLGAHHFPFLASMSRPFTKFCINNAVLPLVYLLLYLVYTYNFQRNNELWESHEILINIASFLIGMLFTITLYVLYFRYTNRDIAKFLDTTSYIPATIMKNLAIERQNKEIALMQRKQNPWRVDTYLNALLKPKIVRSVAHYDAALLSKVFRQNHLNVLFVQLLTLFVLFGLGYMMDRPAFRIPAGASVYILGGILISIIGSFNYWLDKWRTTVLILMLLGLNALTRFPAFNHENKAYGMVYAEDRVDYGQEALHAKNSVSKMQSDIDKTIAVLNNWKQKTGKTKPKLIILGVSGGGLKATLWTMQVLQKTDSLLNGKMMDHTALITGASGGMIGAAYYRELYLKNQLNPKFEYRLPKYVDNSSKDLLNSIAFAIAANDVFLPYASFKIANQTYVKDRGYIFEKQLNENLDYQLDKALSDYRKAESEALIPMMFISPSIVNDARRLIISPLDISYMSRSPNSFLGLKETSIDAVDFRLMFGNQAADSLRFISALRMNATYPWILPNVHLPSEPEIEVMDAGFRDNMGILNSTRFIQVFKQWILENTDGVILVQINSTKFKDVSFSSRHQGILESLFNPLGILSHILRLQDFEQEANLGFLSDVLGDDNFEVVKFEYDSGEVQARASMTFHLTTQEKNNIKNAYFLPRNQRSMLRLMDVLKE